MKKIKEIELTEVVLNTYEADAKIIEKLNQVIRVLNKENE